MNPFFTTVAGSQTSPSNSATVPNPEASGADLNDPARARPCDIPIPVSNALETTIGNPISSASLCAALNPPIGCHLIIAKSAYREKLSKSAERFFRMDSSAAIRIGTSILTWASSFRVAQGCSTYSNTFPKRRWYSNKLLIAAVSLQPALTSRRIFKSGSIVSTSSTTPAPFSKSSTLIFTVLAPGKRFKIARTDSGSIMGSVAFTGIWL